MKIGIITFHATWNCGAVLQCVALKTKLESMGHQVCVINYRPVYNVEKYRKYPNPLKEAWNAVRNEKENKVAKKIFVGVKKFVKTIWEYNPKGWRIRKEKEFCKFREKNFDETIIYNSIEELKNNPPLCDVYISGSDQVWNPTLTNGNIDEAYFCDFGPDSVKRIGYAVSACQLDIEKEKNKLGRLVKRFDRISLREVEKRDELEKIYGKNINICIDPTLLLTKEDYKYLESVCKDTDEPYICVYAFDYKESRTQLFETVKRVKEQSGLHTIKVISGPRKWPFRVEQYRPRNGVTPGEFLWYIKNAEIVITNSFHATTFSIIYGKKFYSLIVQGRGSRVVELLENIGLKNRLIQDESDIVNLKDTAINYNIVENRLDKFRNYATNYIREATEGKKVL